MRHVIKPGRIYISLLMILLFFQYLHAADVEVSVSSDVTGVNEPVELSVSVSGADSVEPLQIPKADGLTIRYAGTSSSFRFVNGKTWSGKVLQYQVTPLRSGNITIPAVSVRIDGKIVQTKPINITVQKGQTGNSRSPFPNFPGFPSFPGFPDSDDDYTREIEIKGGLSVPKKTYFVGEAIPVRLTVIVPRNVRVGMQGFVDPPSFNGCLAREVESSGQDNAETVRIAARYAVVPQKAGVLSIGGGKGRITVQQGQFGFGQDYDLEFPSVEIRVMPVPEAGKPLDFNGLVGSFTIEGQCGNFSSKVYEEKSFPITIKGRGSLAGLSFPFTELMPSSVKMIVQPGKESVQLEGDSVVSENQYTITMIPQTEGTTDLGELVLRMFNPATQKYESISAGSVSIDVSGVKEQISKEEKIHSFRSVIPVWIWAIIGGVLVCVGIVAIVTLYDRRMYSNEDVDSIKEKKKSVPDKKMIVSRPSLQEKRMKICTAYDRGELDLFLQRAGQFADDLKTLNPDSADASLLHERVSSFRYSGKILTKENLSDLKKMIEKMQT